MDIRARIAYYNSLYERIHADDLRRRAEAIARSRKRNEEWKVPRFHDTANDDPEYEAKRARKREYNRRYREKNKLKINAYYRRWYAANKKIWEV